MFLCSVTLVDRPLADCSHPSCWGQPSAIQSKSCTVHELPQNLSDHKQFTFAYILRVFLQYIIFTVLPLQFMLLLVNIAENPLQLTPAWI